MIDRKIHEREWEKGNVTMEDIESDQIMVKPRNNVDNEPPRVAFSTRIANPISLRDKINIISDIETERMTKFERVKLAMSIMMSENIPIHGELINQYNKLVEDKDAERN